MMRERIISEKQFSVALAEMIASLENTDPNDVPFRLYDYVDGEALDRLVTSGNPDLTVKFTIEEYAVTITGAGRVVVSTERPDRLTEADGTYAG